MTTATLTADPSLSSFLESQETSGSPLVSKTLSAALGQAQIPERRSLQSDEIIRERTFESAEYRVCPIDAVEESFRHSHWAILRQKTFDAMARLQLPPHRLERFAHCGAEARVEQNQKTGECRIHGSYCHDRFCRPCAAARGRKAAAAIRQAIDVHVVRFITLTLRHSSLPLSDQIQRLRRCFATLRHSRLWKDAVVGGVSVIEVKVGEDGRWHPHLHNVVQGQWIDRDELSKAWLAITGDSHVVDVRKVDAGNAEKDLTSYLCKYVAKPAGVDVMTDSDKFEEYILAMKGVRVLNFLGTWRKFEKALDAIEETDKEDWKPVGSLERIILQARDGDPWSLRVLQNLTKHRTEAIDLTNHVRPLPETHGPP